jgi:hypothetical protein
LKERKLKRCCLLGRPKFGEDKGRNTGVIVEKLLEKRKEYEDTPAEATVEETCQNLVPFLKLISGCKCMNNV